VSTNESSLRSEYDVGGTAAGVSHTN